MFSGHQRRLVFPSLRFPANRCRGLLVRILRSASPFLASRFIWRCVTFASFFTFVAICSQQTQLKLTTDPLYKNLIDHITAPVHLSVCPSSISYDHTSSYLNSFFSFKVRDGDRCSRWESWWIKQFVIWQKYHGKTQLITATWVCWCYHLHISTHW